MKSLTFRLSLAGCACALLLTAGAQPVAPAAGGASMPQINTNAPAAPDQVMPPPEGTPQPGETAPNEPGTAPAEQETPAMPAIPPEAPAVTNDISTPQSQYVPPPGPQISGQSTTNLSPTPGQSAMGGENELHLNFRNAPLEMVLNYLSDAAGFIIELDTPVHGKVDVWSNQPVTKDEAVDLLNSVLNKNGYAAIRNGRTLEIMEKHAAVTSNIPVKSGEDPQAVPMNDEIVTQIIPIRFVQAAQLVTDLSPLIAPQAIVANEAGNSIIITDTQANIRHAVEIIRAIDSSAEDETDVRVFHLKFADPNDMATLLAGLFPDQTGNGAMTPIRFGGAGGRFGGFGGFGGFPFGGFGGGGGGGRGGGGNGGGNNSPGNTTADRLKKRDQVIAVPDPRTSSIVVTASKDLMDQIAAMVEQLDVDSAKVQHVHVFHLDNADAQEVMPVLQSMFQKNNSSPNNNSSTQTSPMMSRTQQNESSTSTGSSSSSGFGSGSGSRSLGGSSTPQF